MATVKKNSELGLLNRYQRGLLWGGGIALSIMILIASSLAIRSNVKDYIAEGRYVYLTHKALLLLEIEAKRAEMHRVIIDAEILWGNRRAASEHLAGDFARQGGRIVIQAGNKVMPQLALGAIGEKYSAAAFANYLTFAEAHANTASARQLDVSGYLYNPESTFISIIPPPIYGDPLKEIGVVSVVELIKQVAPDIGNLDDPAIVKRLRNSRAISWVPPERDLFTGKRTFKLVQPAFDGDQAFMIFVTGFPSEVLADRLHQAPYDGNFIILDASGKSIWSTWYNAVLDPGLTERVVDSRSWQKNLNSSEYFFDAGTFTISEPLSDTGWILAYAYSWRTILAAHWPVLLAYLVGTLILLAMLWIFLLVFDRKVFMPIFQRSQRMFESENLNRTIIATAPLGLSLLSIRSGEVLLQNEVMRSYDNETTSLRHQFLALYRDKMNTHNVRRGKQLINHDLAVKLADGTTSHLLLNLSESKYQGVEVLLCSFSDITVRKHLEHKLEEAREAADAANHAKSSFLATMSHEIRTPLNAILGNLELLARSQLNAVQADRLRTITSSSKFLLVIINDILDFSKVESGQMTLENTRFDVIDTVEQAATIFAPLAAAKGLNLFYTMEPGLPRFYFGDPTRLRQILLNLLSNAIKFTDSGKVSVAVRNHVVAGQTPILTISVSDTGIGITAVRQRDLFQPFTQAEVSTNRRFGGSGLGLALCKRMAELMGGTISLESQVNGGSTFTIGLPLHADKAELQPIATFESAPTILLLCPAPEWRAFIGEQLRYWGMTVRAIDHPDQAPSASLPLLIFGDRRIWSVQDEDRICERASKIIDAVEDGPRAPVTMGKRSVVSCYSLDGLFKALTYAVAPLPGVAGGVAEDDQPASKNMPAAQSVRVLVVEDHEVNLALIGDQLNTLGYQADLTNSGSVALELFGKNQYDIILTDLSMPKMDGYTLSLFLRRRGAQLPIIATTAHASADEYRRCRQAGITDVLAKPMSLDEIDRMIRRHVKSSDAGALMAVPKAQKPAINAELLQALRDANGDSLTVIHHAFSKGDLRTVLEHLHSIKGAFSMIREEVVVAACARLEQYSKDNNRSALTDALPMFERLLHDVLARLEKEVWHDKVATLNNGI